MRVPCRPDEDGIGTAHHGAACPGATVQRRLLQLSRRIQREIRARSQARNYAGWVRSKLKARDGDGWDVACDDFVTGLLGIIGLDKAMEAVCAGKSLYDNRDAFKCLFGGSKTTTIITETTMYDFNYAWKIDFPSIQGWLTKTGSNKVMSCVNCGFSVSNIAFLGKIVVSITEGVITIKSADVSPGMSGTANMIVRL
ncbi:hypothetical protein C8A00DRAFT_37923 [Chaetomidium leptoderma]|uniref:Uncharacterized protein n=1 Tax=Chaetomidium leptoderma TaxID=669021 RepID=A0AAN6VDP4_9PEZI|nr:hypothetical protein C8A00DRAFT_37923 [Chaetomidium leptoderma]